MYVTCTIFRPTNVEYKLSDISMNSDEILNQINDVLLSSYELFNNEMQEESRDIRHLDTIDKLWEILICRYFCAFINFIVLIKNFLGCEDTQTLRDSFNFLFENLSNAHSPVHYVSILVKFFCYW